MRKRGFTLIELLAVVAIIGILASIVMVSLTGSKAKSRDSRRIADIKSIQLALSQYYSDNGMYPMNIYSTQTATAATCAATPSSAGCPPKNGLAPTYLPTVPVDPSNTGTCSDSNGSAGATCYKYVSYTPGSGGSSSCNYNTAIPVSYHLGAVLEDTTNTALNQDVDACDAAGCTYNFTSYNKCSVGITGANQIHGTSVDCSSTAGTAQPAGTEKCYDAAP